MKNVVKKESVGYSVLILLGLVFLLIMSLMPPIKQVQQYHDFSDSNTAYGILNFWNVISNIPFLLVSVFLFYKVSVKFSFQYVVLLIGTLLVSIGSGYYHLNPSNETLIWDRLPMTIVFMVLVSIVISEFVSYKIGRKILMPLMFFGISSVFYWVVFDDLKPYVFVQFYPMIGIPIILIFFKTKYTEVSKYWFLLLFYVIAKVCEHFDAQIFHALKIISGHSLKHVFSAVGLFVFFYCYKKRSLNCKLK